MDECLEREKIMKNVVTTRHRLGESPNTLDLILTNEDGMINTIIPTPSYRQQRPPEEPMAPQPRLNLFKGNYGKNSKDMQSIDWDTTLQGQPFTDAYRVFCNILKENWATHSHHPQTEKKQEPLCHPESKEPTPKKDGQLGLIHKI